MSDRNGHTNGRVLPSAAEWLRSHGSAAEPATAPLRQPPRAPQPYRPFPVDALPRPIARLTQTASAAIGCDPVNLALPALAACAGAIGNSRCVRLKRKWSEPSVLWTVVVGESGTLKTPPHKLVMAPMHAIEREWRESYKLELTRWREQMEAWKDQRRARTDEGGSSREPVRPSLRRCCCSDVTVERLAELLEDNPRGLLMARDELRGWFGSFSRYKSQAGTTDVPNWLEMHSAGHVSHDRKTGDRRSVSVSRAAVSVTGGIQPGTLARALTPEYFDSGLVARLLMAWPPRRKKVWTEDDVPDDVESAYASLVAQLLALTPYRNREGLDLPYAIKLSPQAKRLWIAFYESWADTQWEAQDDLAALYSKIEGAAPRLALLHHTVTLTDLGCDDRREMGEAAIEAGITLARWFAAESARIYAAIRESDEDGQTRRLIEWISARGGRATPRDLQRSNAPRWPSTEVAEAALDDFVRAGLGNWETSASSGGRPPSRVFVLALPTAPTSDNPTKAPEPPDSPASDGPHAPFWLPD